MDLIVFGAVLGVLILFWAIRGWLGLATRSRALPILSRKGCNWIASHGRETGNLREFYCSTCGVTAYSTVKTGPQQCKKGLERSKL